MRVLWTREAEQDRADIWEYTVTDNSSAAARMDRLFSEVCAALADFPMRGHVGKILGTRELIPHESSLLSG